VVFQCRGHPSALHLALRVARPQATVIDLAFYQAGAADLRLGAEFHHQTAWPYGAPRSAGCRGA